MIDVRILTKLFCWKFRSVFLAHIFSIQIVLGLHNFDYFHVFCSRYFPSIFKKYFL